MKSSGELEKEFVENIKPLTGQDLKSWLTVIRHTGIPKRNDIIKWLKNQHGFGHVNASWLAGIYLNNGKMVYQSEQALLNDQLTNREAMQPLLETLIEVILQDYPQAKMIPKKTYVSFTAKREFIAINVMVKEVRVGLDLGRDHPFDGVAQKAKLTGPMPRLSHMVILTTADQIDGELSKLIRKSYHRVN